MKGTEVPNPWRSSAWLSRDFLILVMRILFRFCLCKVRSQALCNLSLAFLALSGSTALIRFLAFSRKLHSAFRLDRKTRSQHSHVFCLTSTAALHCGHTFVGDILTAIWPIVNSQRTALPRTKWLLAMMHTRFPRSKKWPNYHVAVPTGNTLASQRSIFRKQKRRLVSFVARIITCKVRCWVTDTQTHTHIIYTIMQALHPQIRDTTTDTQTKYCNPHCACAPRVNNMVQPLLWSTKLWSWASTSVRGLPVAKCFLSFKLCTINAALTIPTLKLPN